MRDFYEGIWADLPPDPEPWQWSRRRALLAREVRLGERVLDLGCGAGRFLDVVAAAGGAPVGVDIAERALERAARNAPGADLRLLAADGTLPLGHGEVQLVWCSEVIEHVPDVGALLSEVHRVLAPGGRLLLTTPAHQRLRAALTALVAFEAHFDPLGEHVRFFTRRSLDEALRVSGLLPTRIEAVWGPPLMRSTLLARARRD